MRCHNAIPHTSRGELTRGGNQLLTTKSITNIVFYISSLKRLVLTLTEDIITGTETEKQDKIQISVKKFRNLSHFELQSHSFPMRQILK